MTNVEPATFLATFPDIQSAFRISGERNGMRLLLDVPESEIGAAIKCMLWRGQVVRVAIVPEEDLQSATVQNTKDQNANTALETRTKRQPKWQTTEGVRADGAAGGEGPQDDRC